MAIAVDASSPARWSGTIGEAGSITSASFTAPADALLVLCVEYDTASLWTSGTRTASDSGGLTWTTRVERLGSETTAGAGSGIWTARTTSSASRTVTFALGSPNAFGAWGTGRVSAYVYVLTGVDVDGTPVDTVGASNEGGSGTNSLTTTSITPGGTGLIIAADADWNQLGVFTSSDLTISTADYASAISVVSGYKTCTSGVGVTANLDAGGTGTAQHKWCQIIVREAGGGTPSTPFRLFNRPNFKIFGRR
jgi:hypothetical protein